MGKRNYRISDVVAAVCLPSALLLYLHLNLLHSNLQSTQLRARADSGQREEETGTLEQQQQLMLAALPPIVVPELPPPLPSPLGPPLNLTGEGLQHVLLYTPILQSGSSTIRNLLGFLKRENQFKLLSEPPQKTIVIHMDDQQMQERIVKNISAVKEPTALIHSFAHINFERFGGVPPIQISVVREPVERAVSLFYRVRAPYQLVERYRQFPDLSLPTRRFLKKSLENCLMTPRDPECRYMPGSRRFGHNVEFFCGHHKECLKFGSGEALMMAMRNVDRRYAVVGLLEEWDMTMAVLERFVPRFFANATNKYYDKIHGHQGFVNQNFYKPKVEAWAKEALAKNMTVETQFYNFLKRRLKMQHDALYGGPVAQ